MSTSKVSPIISQTNHSINITYEQGTLILQLNKTKKFRLYTNAKKNWQKVNPPNSFYLQCGDFSFYTNNNRDNYYVVMSHKKQEIAWWYIDKQQQSATLSSLYKFIEENDYKITAIEIEKINKARRVYNYIDRYATCQEITIT